MSVDITIYKGGSYEFSCSPLTIYVRHLFPILLTSTCVVTVVTLNNNNNLDILSILFIL